MRFPNCNNRDMFPASGLCTAIVHPQLTQVQSGYDFVPLVKNFRTLYGSGRGVLVYQSTSYCGSDTWFPTHKHDFALSPCSFVFDVSFPVDNVYWLLFSFLTVFYLSVSPHFLGKSVVFQLAYIYWSVSCIIECRSSLLCSILIRTLFSTSSRVVEVD